MFNIGFFYEKMSDLLIPSFLVSEVSESLRSLTKNERCEPIAQVAQQKWVTMSNSLRSLRGNKQLWANRSGCPPKCPPKMSEWANRWFVWVNRSFFGKNEQFTRKTDEQVPSPAASPWLLKFPKSNIDIGYVSRNHTTLLHFILPDCSFRTSKMFSKFIIDGCVLAWSSPGLCSCSWWYICRKCVYKVSDYADTLCAWSSTMPTLSSLPGHRFFVK